MLVSSAETIGAFNTGFDAVKLHRPTRDGEPRHVNSMACQEGH